MNRSGGHTMECVDPMVQVMRLGEGHLPSSDYVDMFWTPVLGPTAILTLRRLVGMHGERLHVEMMAECLGVGPRVMRHALNRLAKYRLVHYDATVNVLTVAGHVTTLSLGQQFRLPAVLRAAHVHSERV